LDNQFVTDVGPEQYAFAVKYCALMEAHFANNKRGGQHVQGGKCAYFRCFFRIWKQRLDRMAALQPPLL
jgi:hypothetical protein